ncbi:MAG: hypothetical protein JNM60_01635 [Candidatus Competibacteraceae bacterium]|nr:hypothetical protein [Candidatus Competibacteraceae bacterium]
MLGHDLKNVGSLKQWLDKLFPVGTQVFDQLGIAYFVTGWTAANDRVHIRLTHGAGRHEQTRDVPFDQIICWARFLPEPQNEPQFKPNPFSVSLAAAREWAA